MSNPARFNKYTFQGRSGYVIGASAGAAHELAALGHTASVAPWSDPLVHLHEQAEECYLLLAGELRLLVGTSVVLLAPREMLVVKPQVPHAVVGGAGLVEHIGLRAPALQDKQIVGEIPQELPPAIEGDERELRRDWGYRIPLGAAENQNCWLLGFGAARFQSAHLILAYINFPTAEAANAGMGTRHRPHLHQESWEYYVALQGARTLWVDEQTVTIEAGEILEVPPNTCHTLYGRQPPFEGFLFRVPLLKSSDKVECSIEEKQR